MTARLVGNSLIAFGVGTIVASVVAAYFLDAFTLDILAIVVAALGTHVRDGNRTTAKWATAIMGYYAFVGIMLAIFAVAGSGNLRMGGRPVAAELLPWALGVGLVVAVWAMANLALLLVVLRRSAEWRDGGGEQKIQQAPGQKVELHPLRSQFGVASVMLGAVLVGLGLLLHPALFVTGVVVAAIGLVLKPPGTWGVR